MLNFSYGIMTDTVWIFPQHPDEVGKARNLVGAIIEQPHPGAIPSTVPVQYGTSPLSGKDTCGPTYMILRSFARVRIGSLQVLLSCQLSSVLVRRRLALPNLNHRGIR